MNEGFIKIYRSMLEWEWYQDEHTARLFFHLLLKANWKPNRWRGLEIGRGQTLETVRGLAKDLNMSVRSVRTALFHLKSTHEVTWETTQYGMLINVINYAKYQDSLEMTDTQIDTQNDTRPTQERHTSDTRPTLLEEGKEIKNSKKERIESKTHTPPTIFEVREFFFNEGYDSDPEDFYQYNEARKWKDKAGNIVDWKVKASDWERHEKKFSSSQSDIKVPVPDWWPEE